MNQSILTCLLILVSLIGFSHAEELPANLKKENLAAWCIVPFDAKKRGPKERAEMLVRLGITKSAYDWRKQHIGEFEEEIQQYQKHGIEFFAFWNEHDDAFRLFKKYGLRPQVWRTLVSPKADTQEDRVKAAVEAMEPLAKKTAAHGFPMGLYNHGGWGGEPAHLVAVCKALRKKGYDHVGIVYNWHHGHDQINEWAAALKMMTPYLLCLNLNGMNVGADPKIQILGQGEHELEMLRVLIDSKYKGPIGILDHQNDLDTEQVLRDNLAGLEKLKHQIKTTTEK